MENTEIKVVFQERAIMSGFKVRTDLALEMRESMEESAGECRGVSVEEDYREESEIKITRVIIETMNGAKAMGKPMGSYITLEAPAMTQPDENYHQEISEELSRQLKEIIPGIEEEISIMVVGLGNRDVTADALGPNVVDNLVITRHMVKEYGKVAFNKKQIHMISGLIPGVMAKTGMESQEIIRGVVEKTKPDVVIVVDALAARSTRRLNRTIQISNTGIHPGSGVGNHRRAITKETIGTNVIAIGVPTVIDTPTIVYDTLENLLKALSVSQHFRMVSETFRQFNDNEKYQLIREIIAPEMSDMFVTPKDADETIKRIGYTISEAINIATNS